MRLEEGAICPGGNGSCGGALMSKGSKYSDQDRLRAVQEYHRCGSLAEVSESTGIPRKTLGDWFRTGWWDELLAEVRRDDGEPVSSSGEVGEVAETKIGRPTAYKKEYAEQAMRLCLLGATDQEMAGFFSVSEQTINTWKGKHPSFLESMRKGKIEADANVAERLYERAIGSDFQSMALWLKNRRPSNWRETRHIKVDTVQHTAVVILEPELVAKMDKAAGIDREVIEGECEYIENTRDGDQSNGA